MIKQHKTEGKSKLQNELIIIESENLNMSLLHKHPVIEYKLKICGFELKFVGKIVGLNHVAVT